MKKATKDSDYSIKYKTLMYAGQRSYEAKKKFLDNNLDFCAEFVHRSLKRERGHGMNVFEMGHRLKAIDPNTTRENFDIHKALNELREWDLKNPKRDTYSDYTGHCTDYLRGYNSMMESEWRAEKEDGGNDN